MKRSTNVDIGINGNIVFKFHRFIVRIQTEESLAHVQS